MRRGVLWDSSAVLALLDADDRDHDAALQIAGALAKQRSRSFVTNYVHVETHALLLSRLGRALARQWLLTATLPVLRVSAREEQRARELIVSYRDKDWSLCDAISFAVIEQRRVRKAFSFDHHFFQFGCCTVLGRSDHTPE